jgi:hypothetical protein
MTASRRITREQLAIAIASYMTTAQAIYDHKPAELAGSPAVMVLSAGSDRSNKSTVSGFGAVFHIEIHNLVNYANPKVNWTEEDGEDALDALELEVATFMDTPGNLKGLYWKTIRFAGRSIIGKTSIGGTDYQDEIIPLQITVSG